MPAPSRTMRRAEKIGTAMKAAKMHARRTGELATAAGHVIATRMALGANAMIDPLNADHAEFARLIPEKTSAFSEAGVSLLHWSSAAAGQMANFATTELAGTATAAAALSCCRTPAALVAMQTGIATAWLARALSQALSLGTLAMKSQRDAMDPLHRTATANARRLGR